MTRPMRKTGLRRSRRQALATRDTPGASSTRPASLTVSASASILALRLAGLKRLGPLAGVSLMAASPGPHAWVDDGVEHVDDEVDEDEDRGGGEDQDLKHGVVAPLEADRQGLADAAECEHSLGEDGAGQERAGLQSDGRDDGEQRVAQDVAAANHPVGQAL